MIKSKIILLSFFFFCANGAERPNIILILADDMGYSDLGCYGGEIETPNLDLLAENGIRYTQAYNTSKCWTTRISLLTGLYHHRTNRDFENTALVGKILKSVVAEPWWSGKHHAGFNPSIVGSIIFRAFLVVPLIFGIRGTTLEGRTNQVGEQYTLGHLMTKW